MVLMITHENGYFMIRDSFSDAGKNADHFLDRIKENEPATCRLAELLGGLSHRTIMHRDSIDNLKDSLYSAQERIEELEERVESLARAMHHEQSRR